MLAGQVEFVNI